MLKLHGSVDWFSRMHYEELKREVRKRDPNYEPRDPIFNSSRGHELVPLVDGPRFADDPLENVYRLRNERRYYESPSYFLPPAPLLLVPSTQKLLLSDPLKSFFWGWGRGGAYNLRMVIIGYSLPKHDEYALQLLYRLIRNYQWNWEEKLFGNQREPVTLVDFRQSESEIAVYKRRFSFVDWDRAQTHLAGFNQELVDRLARASGY